MLHTIYMKRKKVLFLITKSNWGGAQRYVHDLATTLDYTLYEPVVVLGGEGELKDKLEAANIRTISLTSLQRDISLTKEFSFARELWRTIKKEQPDVLHVNSSKAGGVGCFVGRLARVPQVIFTAHGWAFNEDRPWWQRFVIKKLHWWTVILSHHTIAVSRAMVTQMNWPLARSKMSVINPGRTIPEFAGKLQARQAIAHAQPDLIPHMADVWLIIVAELHPIKQHLLLFAAMKNISSTYPNVRLVCVGDGESRSMLDTYITDHNLEETIFMTGAIHEAAQHLKAADAFVLPSASESYGYVLHEAGLAHVPIIASAVGGITDIVTDGTTGTLVSQITADTLTTAITSFLEQPHTYQEQARTLQQQLQTRTVQDMTQKTVAIYEDTASSTASSSS